MSSRISLSNIGGTHTSSCGYCKGTRSNLSSSSSSSSFPSSSPLPSSKVGSVSYGASFQSLTPHHYQSLADNGWRRSGSYCYLPDNETTCCPAHSIRLRVDAFVKSKSQKKVEKHFLRECRRLTEESESGRDGKGLGPSKRLEEESASFTSSGFPPSLSLPSPSVPTPPSSPDSSLLSSLSSLLSSLVSSLLLPPSSSPSSTPCVVVRSSRPPPERVSARAKSKGKRTKVYASSFLVKLAWAARGGGGGGGEEKAGEKGARGGGEALRGIVGQVADLLKSCHFENDEQDGEGEGGRGGTASSDPFARVAGGRSWPAGLTYGGKKATLMGADVDEGTGYVNFYVAVEEEDLGSESERGGGNGEGREKSKKRREKQEATVKKLDDNDGDTDAAADVAPSSPPSFTARLVPSLQSLSDPDVHRLYASYQSSVHGDADPYAESSNPTPASIAKAKKSFQRFLCDSPLVPALDTTIPMPPPDEDGFDVHAPYGTYHMQFRLKSGLLIAVSVIDVLPNCVSSVYCFYDSALSRDVNLGTFTALHEIELVRRMSLYRPSLAYYYLGFYIHSCTKMRYKASFRTSEIRCPVTGMWVTLDDAAMEKLGDVQGRGGARLAPMPIPSTTTTTTNGSEEAARVEAPSSVPVVETLATRRAKTGRALVGALKLDLGAKRGGVVAFRNINEEARKALEGHLQEFAGNVGLEVATNVFIES